jgi:hypothetical protein
MVDVFWSAWDGRGFEHLRLVESAAGVDADSVMLALDESDRPFRARYRVTCDPTWRVTRARVDLLDEPGRTLELRAAGGGRWIDAATGEALPLDGCVDVDIYPTPFTNSLPVRRLAAIGVGAPVAIDVAWVKLPELTVHVAPQEYTLLERTAEGARWRFRALDADFTVELDVDRHGLVRDYPDIARRVL